MKKLFLTAFCGLGALGGLCLAPQAAAQTTIYADNFTGSSSDPLDGTTPGTESGTLGGSSSVAWSAKSDFNADGSIGNGYNSDGSAALPFVPQAGEIYTLSTTLDTTAGGWLAVGFEDSDSTNQTFYSSNGGSAWMLQGSGGAAYFPGPGTTGGVGVDSPAVATLSIVLDTTEPAWTESFFVDGTAVAGPLTPASNPTINYVALGELGPVAGTASNFSLTTAAVPEPSTWGALLSGFGLLASFQRFRRSRRA